jgi:hypothetical protein
MLQHSHPKMQHIMQMKCMTFLIIKCVVHQDSENCKGCTTLQTNLDHNATDFYVNAERDQSRGSASILP